MKGGFYGLRAKQLSLVLIALVCITILIWAWEKTPLLTSLLPPQSHLLQLTPGADQIGLVESSPEISNVETNVIGTAVVKKGNVTAGKEKEMVNDQEELHFGAAVPPDHANSTTEVKYNETNIITTPVVMKEEPKHEQISKGKQSFAQTGKSVEFVATVDSINTVSSMEGKENSNLTTHIMKQACNYAIGKWVVDDNRPLYSGSGCKQWLSGMWACRLTQRMDFMYEKLKWQTKNCEIEEFTGSNFLRRMQNKTLAFVGDSLGRQQFQSLMCMVTGGKERPDVIDVGREYGLVKARGATRPDGWAYRFPSTNTTILYYWSASLCDLEPLESANPTTDYAMHLDRPPAFLHRYLHKFDVLVLNTGHHWNRGKLKVNRWIMHVGGVPNTNTRIASIGGAKNFTIYSIVNWVNLQMPKYPKLKAFYRSVSPRHFFNGDWNTGGTCDNTTPLSGGKEVLQGESGDAVAAGAVKGTKVQLLDITALSQLRDEGHISRYSIKAMPGVQDCLHWCLPGVPDTWNEILFAQL